MIKNLKVNKKGLTALFLAGTLALLQTGCSTPTEPTTMFISRDYAPVRANPYQDGIELERLQIGTEIEVIDSIRNTKGNFWFNICPDGAWIYSGNVTYDLTSLEDCTIGHSFDARGFCISCGEEYELNIIQMERTLFEIENANNILTTPARVRPYANEDEIREPLRLVEGTEIIVNASARNERNNLWYRFEYISGTGETQYFWVYSGNVNQLHLEQNNQFENAQSLR